jgi:predicted dehydrogenase
LRVESTFRLPLHHRLRIAVVGAGAIGRRHIDYLRADPGFELVGVADPGAAAGAWLQARGVPHHDDYAAMLGRTPVDGVIIAAPNALHEPVALACLARRVPVMIEKPIAHSIDSARRIAAAVARAGVPALVGHHRRHNPLMQAARDFIEGGGIGRIVAVAASDLRRKPDGYYDAAWRREPGGGPLLINGIHDIDCLRALCGEIDSVMAMASSVTRGFDVEDTMAVTLRFAGGALGNLTLSDAVQAPWAWEIASGEEPDYPHQAVDVYRICGTAGALEVPTLVHWRNQRGGGRGDPFVRERLGFARADPWQAQLRHFAQMLRGETAPRVDVADATRTLAAALAIARSASLGRPVAVQEMYPAGDDIRSERPS